MRGNVSAWTVGMSGSMRGFLPPMSARSVKAIRSQEPI